MPGFDLSIERRPGGDFSAASGDLPQLKRMLFDVVHSYSAGRTWLHAPRFVGTPDLPTGCGRDPDFCHA